MFSICVVRFGYGVKPASYSHLSWTARFSALAKAIFRSDSHAQKTSPAAHTLAIKGKTLASMNE
jgi:hypothetical protein